MTIVAKVGNNETYTPVEIRFKGLFKKKTEAHQDFADLNKTIDYCKRHNKIYEGLVDLYEFNLDGNIINLQSKLTYEEVFTWNPIKEGLTFFGKKDEGTWAYRKYLRTSSESLKLYKNPEGSEYEMGMGHPDPIIDAKIMYDAILYSLNEAQLFLERKKTKLFVEMFDVAKSLLKNARDHQAIDDWNDFDQIVEYFESKK